MYAVTHGVTGLKLLVRFHQSVKNGGLCPQKTHG